MTLSAPQHTTTCTRSATGRHLVVQDTAGYGKGVFAGEDIQAGEVVHVFDGVRMSVRDLVDKVNAGEEHIDDPLQIGRQTYLDLDELSRTFNHSCDPNAALRKTCELFAIRPIRKGQQITYDYSLTIAPTHWTMRCQCGTPHCRRVLGDLLSVPRSRLRHYQRLGALQRYMRALLKDIDQKGRYVMPPYEVAALERLNHGR